MRELELAVAAKSLILRLETWAANHLSEGRKLWLSDRVF
jgi:hypothetical protein